VRRALLLGLLAALCVPADGLAGRWAVGAPPGRFGQVAAQLPGARTLVPGRTLLVRGARPHVRGAAYVSRLDGAVRKVAFANTEPYQSRQWYLDQDRAWEFWPRAPELPSVKVAVIDSGIDYGHPEFAGRVVGGRSFVGTPWQQDTDGHGTFVAGLIAADPFNGVGIAGLGFNVGLLIGKVVLDEGVSPEAEVKAIVWAVKQGARVINLSLGGVRDPTDPRADTFSAPERDAVAYAYSHGVVVVVAVGNGTDSPSMPWNFADWPASLPHAIGVAALREDGSVPAYSNRDRLFVDIAAPGDAIVSTIPRGLIDATRASCTGEAYSDCGPAEFRDAIGTSFAAPQVSAAAALLLGQDPGLKPDQVSWLLERSATDVTPATGCSRCVEGRDGLTGWGRLNVLAALKQLKQRTRIPFADAYESNDDAGVEAHPFGPSRAITATLDYWDDPLDVYAIKLQKGESLFAHLSSTIPLGRMQLWTPDTTHVGDPRGILGNRAASSAPVGGQQRLVFDAPAAGTYYLLIRVGAPTRQRPLYALSIAKQRPST
jgi:subtilisin family serine protease